MRQDNEGRLVLKPEVVSLWIDRLRARFPKLDRFGNDPDFEEDERNYKVETAKKLRKALKQEGSDREVVDAIRATKQKTGNLLGWRIYPALSPKNKADRNRLWPALSELARAAKGDPNDHPAALEKFVNSWLEAVPDGKPEPARQIAEFLFLHLYPKHGIYIRVSVRKKLWLEAVGSEFPECSTMAETYAEELRFMQAVYAAFEERDLAPRDMIDVQSALWVIQDDKYTEAAKVNKHRPLTREAIEDAMDAEGEDRPKAATNLILYGPPGTGKTHETAYEAVRLCLGENHVKTLDDRENLMEAYRNLVDEERVEFVTFHQSFSYEDFVEGLRPEVRKEGAESGGFSLKPRDGLFKRISERARLDTARDYVLIIDEINRANISKVFGELITLLEPDKRLGETNEVRVRLPYSSAKFGVPSNLHIVGTMNTADRSIALLDTALRRRFQFRELMPDPSCLSSNVEGIDLQKLLITLNGRIEPLFDREHQIGHAYFTDCKTLADIKSVMRGRVIPLLAEYFYDDWSKIASVLEDRSVTLDGDFDGDFLLGRRLAPAGVDAEEGDAGGRLRWTVKSEEDFDFSEFEVG